VSLTAHVSFSHKLSPLKKWPLMLPLCYGDVEGDGEGKF